MSKLASTEDNEALGVRLVTIRRRLGMTQERFADYLDVAPRAYANYERGEREIPTALFRQLCIKERIDPYWLLVGPDVTPVLLGTRQLNADLLERVVRFIENWAVAHRGSRFISIENKAKLIRLAYEHCIQLGVIDTPYIDELLRLVS